MNLNLKLTGKVPLVMDEKKEEKPKAETTETIAEPTSSAAPEAKPVTASVQDVLAAYAQGSITMVSSTENYPAIKNGVSKFRFRNSDITTYLHKGNLGIMVRGDVSPAIFRRHFTIEPLVITPEPENPPEDKPIGVINGEIDEKVSQGGTGDCWILAGVLALNGSESGKKILKESIQTNEDGSVTVHFKGLNVSYTISADEIKKHDTDDNTEDPYSNGDNDMLVLELATAKLLADLKSGKVKLDPPKSDPNKQIPEEIIGDGTIEGGFAQNIIYYLTGNSADYIYAKDNVKGLNKEEVIDFLKKAYENGNTALTFGVYGAPHKAQCTDGSTLHLDLNAGSGHALAITKLTGTTVTFVNPWDSNVEYTMSWEEFAKFGIGLLTSTSLAEVGESKPVDPVDPPVADIKDHNADKFKNVPQSIIDKFLEPAVYNADGSVYEYKEKAPYENINISNSTVTINGVNINKLTIVYDEHVTVLDDNNKIIEKGILHSSTVELYTKDELMKVFGNDPFWKEAFDQYFNCYDKESGLYRLKNSGDSIENLVRGYDNIRESLYLSYHASNPERWVSINKDGQTIYNSEAVESNLCKGVINKYFTEVKNSNGEILGYTLKEPFSNFRLSSSNDDRVVYDFSYEKDGIFYQDTVIINRKTGRFSIDSEKIDLKDSIDRIKNDFIDQDYADKKLDEFNI